MTVDLIDRAFLSRFADPVAPPVVVAPALPTALACEPPPPAAEDPVVEVLLAACPEQWARLAGHVEAAWAVGARVVAVVGRARGDGVSTVIRGLARVLRERGGAVACCEHGGARSGGSADDGPRVLVDGGVWFPAGPVHRGRLAAAAFGCHAVVLVRRAVRAPCPVHAAALADLGIRVLGEVVTFADVPLPIAKESA